MQVATALVLLTCELCLAIRVPVSWDQSASEVKQEIKNDNDEQFSIESFKPQNVNNHDEKPIPVEYFEYTAKKPQFAVDVAKFHGVQSPENHYKAYPIKPHTGKNRPELGKHHLLDKDNAIHKQLQEFTNINDDAVSHAVPVSSNYEVFHPYEAETPALQEIYKDPVLTKIRNDLENSKNRLQTYEKEAGTPDIQKDEYLESPEKTGDRIIPHRNIPAPFEIHRPLRRPIYYRPVPKHHQRENYLNQRLRHPWNQYSAKIRPMHYRPVKNHIHQLRQNHALKYDDERNEYPQVEILENYSSDPKDGYDIYEKGKEKFIHLRNNVDESINKAVQENHPATYEKLEIQNNDKSNDDEEDEFVPIKNYAQVRKTESFKHLPKSAAFADAESYDEIRNAPRLREAVKSTKAQTVYSEEGYEDSAYDHAGEQKHASESEGHGGYLKEHELSGGKYKIPSESAKYEDDSGSTFRDQIIHAEKWKDDNKDSAEQSDEEDYSENDQEKSLEADGYQETEPEDNIHRSKREGIDKNHTDINYYDQNNTDKLHNINSKNANFKVPELDLKSTFLNEHEILNLAKIIIAPKKDDIKQKYPYYFKNYMAISKNSPLRYAENLKHIPKKSKGGTEFYDSRSKFECPEVDDVPDPVPEKLKHGENPDENDDKEEASSSKGDENYDTVKKTPRLKGLGDKIDCFKAKYFGENPLDSPFFKEELILSPEPITLPNLAQYKFRTLLNNEPNVAESNDRNVVSDLDTIQNNVTKNKHELFNIIDKLGNDQIHKHGLIEKTNANLISVPTMPKNISNDLNQQFRVYNDVLDNINKNSNIKLFDIQNNKTTPEKLTNLNFPLINNITYSVFQNKEDITQSPPNLRKKRSTSFVYEPYKIIRDSQIQDSKKTTTTGNISPLIKQLQSSRVVDRVSKVTHELDNAEKHVKRNVNTRVYKDIGKKERETNRSKNDKEIEDRAFIDVSVDSRRGEPRYEIRHNNHKIRYTPVENKKSISIADYKAQTSTEKSAELRTRGETNIQTQLKLRQPTRRPHFIEDIQNVAASSNSVRKTLATTTVRPTQKPVLDHINEHKHKNRESEEEYEEYDDDEEDEDIEKITSTTSTTHKPSFRRRIKIPAATETTLPESTETPKLKLVTRFRDYKPAENIETQPKNLNKLNTKNVTVTKHKFQESDESVPKYREKKKKSTKSTIVTDTKKYGNDDDDMQKEEVDALIGIKQNMEDYMPLYEKQEQKTNKSPENLSNEEELEEDENEDENSESSEDDIDEDADEDSEDSDEDIDDDNNDEDDDEEEEIEESQSHFTTPEPTKRTLSITTDAPTPTTAASSLDIKPIITKKKIIIHKEIPSNRSSPHVTQYKQDIKEVEIIKEIPTPRKRKPQKNLEALELYKDDNLAKDVNKLGGVEVFKDGIDLKNGPRHGGNYRSLDQPIPSSAPFRERRKKPTKEDPDASQSKFTKHVELNDESQSKTINGDNLRYLNEAQKSISRGRSSKLVELRDAPTVSMHGGNLKSRGRGRYKAKSEKLIELNDDDNHDEENTSNDHESFNDSANSGPMHGGNYRSEQLVVEKNPEATEKPVRSRTKSTRRNSAAILNSFVQAAPILTSTPAFILDPSKRMYYYVDA